MLRAVHPRATNPPPAPPGLTDETMSETPPTLDVLSAALRREPALLVPQTQFAAVAAVFDANLDVLLIGRAIHPADPWSGHIAFPGGRVEPGDDGPVAAAIRETHEEVGLTLTLSHLLGQLDDLAAVGGRPGMVIRPFVFFVPEARPPLVPNHEVASIFWRPLGSLLADEGRTTMNWTHGGASLTLPCVWFDDRRLWGLTLRMIDDLLDRIDGRGEGLRRIRPG